MKILLFIIFTLIFSALPIAPASATAEPPLDCAKIIPDGNPDPIFEKTDEELSPEEITCAYILQWQQGKTEDFDFFNAVPLYIRLAVPERDDLIVHIYRQALEMDENKSIQYSVFNSLANVYSNPESSAHNPEEAFHFYMRSHIYALYNYRDADCSSQFDTYIDNETNDIERSALERLASFCTLSPEDLFKQAENFEYGRNGYKKDSHIAKTLYDQIYYRLESPDSLRRKARKRLDILESK